MNQTSKKSGDIFIGVLPSESNPPNMLEFLDAVYCMANCLLDKVLYTVVDVESNADYSVSTRTHRRVMAKFATSMYSPLVELFDPYDRWPIAGEDAAFQQFALNSDMRFTLFYISTAVHQSKRANIIEKLATNIGMRLHGFDPNMHRVVAAFLENDRGQPVKLEGTAKCLADENILGVIRVKGHGIELSGWNNIDEMVLEAIRGKEKIRCELLASDIAQYISDHQDYRTRLTDYLTVKLGLQS